jgi:hypothetical protein
MLNGKFLELFGVRMRKARHLAISSRLEASKQHGLLEDYAIEWQRHSFSPPRIRIRGRASTPTLMTLNYIASLLGSLLPSRVIEIER